MRAHKLTTLFIFLLTAGLLFASNDYSKWKSLGKPITIKKVTKISTILANPDTWVGKTVLVKGRVVDVCKKRGCWMEIASDKDFQTIKVKVKDGEIVFPLKARGKMAVVQGVVEKLNISREQWIKHLAKEAKEEGKTFNPDSVKAGIIIYRLKGIGAKIDM